jgi:hypothetical protein
MGDYRAVLGGDLARIRRAQPFIQPLLASNLTSDLWGIMASLVPRKN